MYYCTVHQTVLSPPTPATTYHKTLKRHTALLTLERKSRVQWLRREENDLRVRIIRCSTLGINTTEPYIHTKKHNKIMFTENQTLYLAHT